MDVTSSGAVSARLALGVTTVAMVALASAGTAVVVRTGTSSAMLGSLPPQVSLALGARSSGAVIVGGPPGRVWPSDVHAARHVAGVRPITTVGVQQLLSGVAIRGAVTADLTDGPPPLPAPLVPAAPAPNQPVADPPIQTPVDNPPISGLPADHPPIQGPPTDPPAPVTDPTAPPATGGQPAPAPVPPVPAAAGHPVTLPVVAGTPGRPSIRGDQPSPAAEQPVRQPTVVPSPQVTTAHPSTSTKAGHEQGHGPAGDDGPGSHARHDGREQHGSDSGEQYGHDSGDQHGSGHGNRPS